MNFLVVDDEPLVLLDLKDILKKVCPESTVHGFSSARDALCFAKNEPFDVAFLDIELGYTSGIVLTKQLKELQPNIHIIFVTSHEKYAVDAFAIHATGYLLKPAEPEDLERELTFLYGKADQRKKVLIQTFGGFDVFVDGKTILFKRSKAKELLAYLVDRKGCGVTTKEACAILFEDAPYDKAQKNYFQTIVAELKNTLKRAGIEDIFQKSRNNLAINPNSFNCDYYRFLDGDVEAINQYRGNYMSSYSWAEFSIGFLENKMNHFM